MKRIASVLVSFLLVALLACAQTPPMQPSASQAAEQRTLPVTRNRASAGNSASNGFDFYLLNLSWSPEYCHSHASAQECAQHATFVMHGLWPERSDGSYQSNCSSAAGPANPGAYSDLYPDAGLLRHEWQTHGTCSGLAPDTYFTEARQAYKSVVIPKELSQLTSQISLEPSQIIALFQQVNPKLSASNVAISCGNNYLTAVEVCLDKNLQPTSCGAVRSCRAQKVRIPNP